MTIGFNEAVYVISESAGATDICIDLIGTSQRSVLVTLSSANSDTQDFQLPSVPTTLVFQSGESQVCTLVSIINDAIVEGLESFTLELSTSDPAVDNNFRTTALLNIIDDDSKLMHDLLFCIFCGTPSKRAYASHMLSLDYARQPQQALSRSMVWFPYIA